MRKIIVGTRTSKLALIQTNWVIDQLKKAGVQNEIEIKEFMTSGDKNLTVSLAALGGGGIFIEELEQALLNKEIDFAVHSLKDLPAILPEELVITAIPEREDARDAYIGRNHVKLDDLPAGAKVGTSSGRRRAQILSLRPDLNTPWIRGAVDGRIDQLNGGAYDAIILAVAGLKRLGVSEEVITEYLDIEKFVPAPGQGALAIECRQDDEELRNILAMINDEESAKAVTTERELVKLIEGADEGPVGIYAYVDQEEIVLHAALTTSEGERTISEVVRGTDPVAIATEMAAKLKEQNILELIQEELKK